jgi:hypothetical protein
MHAADLLIHWPLEKPSPFLRNTPLISNGLFFQAIPFAMITTNIHDTPSCKPELLSTASYPRRCLFDLLSSLHYNMDEGYEWIGLG